jgi:hypothetical protein
LKSGVDVEKLVLSEAQREWKGLEATRRVAKVPMWASILAPIVLGFVIPFWGLLLAPPLLAVVYAYKARKPAADQ